MLIGKSEERKISLSLPDDVWEFLERMCEDSDMTVNDLISQILTIDARRKANMLINDDRPENAV
jgi:predicted DNA-binding ribbon-helix-helix protein